jgi:hypothetical protein
MDNILMNARRCGKTMNNDNITLPGKHKARGEPRPETMRLSSADQVIDDILTGKRETTGIGNRE